MISREETDVLVFLLKLAHTLSLAYWQDKIGWSLSASAGASKERDHHEIYQTRPDTHSGG